MSNVTSWLNSFRDSSKIPNSKNAAWVVSVTGGKGGVGKTSISLKLGKKYSQQGLKTLLIDCDFNLSNTAIKLGFPVNNKTFYSLISGVRSFEESIIREDQLDILPSCNGDIDLFNSKISLEEFIKDVVRSHQHEYDLIILDCPAGLSEESMSLASFAHDRIFVVTPDSSSLTDSYALMKILALRFNEFSHYVLVNKVKKESEAFRVFEGLKKTYSKFSQGKLLMAGHIRLVNVVHSMFDQYFLSEESFALNQDIDKILYNLSDNLPTGQEIVLPNHIMSRSREEYGTLS